MKVFFTFKKYKKKAESKYIKIIFRIFLKYKKKWKGSKEKILNFFKICKEKAKTLNTLNFRYMIG